MEALLQQRIQRYGWDKAADIYERYWKQQLEPAHALLLESADLKAGEVVLDIACGTGLVTFPAAEAVAPSGRVIGTDISDKMIERVREDARRHGLRNATFQRMEAEALHFADGTFDATLCSLGLMYVTGFLQAVCEMYRVTKPGGRAVAAVWGRRDACGWAEIFPIVDSRVRTEVCPLFFQPGTGDMLAHLFEEAGFNSIKSHRISTVLHYDSADTACGAAFVGGPVALAYSRFDGKTREEAQAEYIESIAPFRNDSGYAIPGEFVVVRGQKLEKM